MQEESTVDDVADHNRAIGKRGEDAAVRYLMANGYDIVERNWRCRFGEVDIIARDDDALVFIEVKTRTSVEHGLPEEAVTPQKRARYEKMAALYLRDYEVVDVPLRFDVIAILVTAPDRAILRHHANAFSQVS